jgi:cell division protein FtsZ
MKGARGLLINITGGSDLTLFEVDQAANRIREEVDEDANIMFGTAIDEELNGRIRISVVATGIDTAMAAQAERPRLVAVGGGHAVADATAPAMAAQTGQQPAAPAEVPSQADIAAQMAQPQGGYPHHAQPHSGQPHSAQPHPVQQLHPAQMPQQQPQQPAAQHHGAQPGGAQHGAVRAPISAQAPLYPREQPARPAEPAKRPSLFNRMTQGLRAAAQAQAPRPAQPTEPPMPSQAPSHNAAPVYAPQQPQQAQPQHPQAHAQQAYPQQGQAQPMRAEHAPGQGAPGQGASGHAASGQMHFRGSHDDHRASVRQMQTEDIGLDIPAFLRRQHS